MPSVQQKRPLKKRTAEPPSKESLRAWLNLIKCSKRVEQEMSDRFRENFNSSLSRFDVLAHLDLAGDQGISTTVLAGKLLASKGNITRLLDRMEQDGMIVRKPTPADRRVSKVFLTKKGAELFSEMAPRHQLWSHEIFSVLSPVEKKQLVKTLKSIREIVDRFPHPPAED